MKETFQTIMDKIKEFFGFGPVDNYDTEAELSETRSGRTHRDDVDDYVSPRTSRGYDRDGGRASRYESSAREPYRYGESHYGSQPQRRVPQDPKYVPLHLSAYKDATEVVDVAKTGDVVVFTLSGVERSEAARALDFISGARRALDADLKKLSGVRNYILIPQGVVLSSDQLESLAQEL
ncbi:cell division protein SepF [Corynebacterium sp. 320]|uniref:cell division protein SepF n=1 Tax=Corynebacterium TaxID=1716 RepID=UPI00125CA8DB|nr:MULTISPECIES: cell division protein SepF [Corynebacterium]KAB1502508.1 cell division protein SepF [Corynebacterium sp. 320]KAB1551271.1 cell division protein SepF [Corynebacterium sp. 321]KAB1551901.1 cell division protein SepF [Corynebacterium sp. 319]KAB3526115.1 cell division protein SepF [Corynebacterium sp. 250]KAB3538895.1 cell division protein SepF [Corynebacterium sp. 366]